MLTVVTVVPRRSTTLTESEPLFVTYAARAGSIPTLTGVGRLGPAFLSSHERQPTLAVAHATAKAR